ncbi:MAG: gamma-glutamyltransferase [Pseudomonadota bacterium]
MSKAAIAAGHRETAQAAADILADGGNAVDAVLAGLLTACVAEPILASIGGGGFLLVRPAEGKPVLYDFFAHTPKNKRPEAETAIEQIQADFGTTTQSFCMGMGTVATPGVISGLYLAHEDHGLAPMRLISEPASRLARTGFPITEYQARTSQIIAPIILATPETRSYFGDPDDPTKILPVGGIFKAPKMADAIESIAVEGPRLFYEGEIAATIAEGSAARGGNLTLQDLADYRTERRDPLVTSFDGATLLTNPPPSAGGALIAFGLSLIGAAKFDGLRFLGANHAALIAKAIALTDRARFESGFSRNPVGAIEKLFDPALLEQFRTQVMQLTPTTRGTTHLSVVDSEGTATCATISNGEGCGWIDPKLGFMLNNMLGEEDVLPNGIGSWVPDTRLSSMMAPTIAETQDGVLTALGSGGSSRIRTAVLQALVNRIGFGKPLDQAVEAPRLHVEGGRADIEPGFDGDCADAIEKLDLEPVIWDQQGMFFGGVHAAERAPNGGVIAAADPRRDGTSIIL